MEKKLTYIHMRISEEDKDKLVERANRKHMSIAEYVRFRCVREEEHNIWQETSKGDQ